mmetsp:Transcript_14917/g.42860  ORF Transcript_14917/g.42860 Transcript_14917/m.42860 type:complete len:276 (-) Transcript_14917:18-845(-)
MGAPSTARHPKYANKYSSHFGHSKARCESCRWYERVMPIVQIRTKTAKALNAPQLKVNGAARAPRCTAAMNRRRFLWASVHASHGLPPYSGDQGKRAFGKAVTSENGSSFGMRSDRGGCLNWAGWAISGLMFRASSAFAVRLLISASSSSHVWAARWYRSGISLPCNRLLTLDCLARQPPAASATAHRPRHAPSSRKTARGMSATSDSCGCLCMVARAWLLCRNCELPCRQGCRLTERLWGSADLAVRKLGTPTAGFIESQGAKHLCNIGFQSEG